MNTICKMRDIYKALSIFETAFEEVYGISLNEAMVLCALREAGKEITSTAIAERTEMAPSHTSKVIRAVEDKGLIRRALGEVTEAGKKRLNELDLDKVEIPEMLKPLI